jgi:hypothetical protein
MRLRSGDRLLVDRIAGDVYLSLLENPTGRQVMVILNQTEQETLWKLIAPDQLPLTLEAPPCP